MKINRLIDSYYWNEMDEVFTSFFNALHFDKNKLQDPLEPLSDRTLGHFCTIMLDECFKYYTAKESGQDYSGIYSEFNSPMIRHQNQVLDVLRKNDFEYILHFLRSKVFVSEKLIKLKQNTFEKNINVLWSEYIKEYADLSTRYRRMDSCPNSSY